MNSQHLYATRARLAEYAQGMQRLLTALDSDAEADFLDQLSEYTTAQFATASAALAHCTPAEIKSLESDLAQLRRTTALADEASQRMRATINERLREVRHARQVLTELNVRSPGESCDIAG